MFGCAAACIVCKIYHSREYHSYAGISMQFMLMHLFYSVFLAVGANRRLVLYPAAVRGLSACCFVCLAVALLVTTPQLDMQLLPTLAVLFVSEVTGCAVLLVSSILKAVADMYAAFFESYT